MRFRLAIATVLLVFGTSSPLVAQVNPHIRSLDHRLARTISEGVLRSPTFARIVDGLERSDVIVYIGFDQQILTSFGGRTTVMTAHGKWRYLRIAICPRLSDFQRTAMVAHELHHALEIGSSSEVHDMNSLRRLYRSIGVPSRCHSECYETTGAVKAAQDVERELRQWSRSIALSTTVARPSHDRAGFVASTE
jgi:hypothetical protein